MLYAYDDEDNAPMIDFFFEPDKRYVYKTLSDLGFDFKMPIKRKEEADD